MPVISVILPVYNGMQYLHASVESVLNQSLNDFEFLILDDRSSDKSYDYLKTIKDNRVRVFHNKTNKGLFYNLNFLVNESLSPIIKLWSQDDIMYPVCLEEVVQFHNQHNSIGFSYSGRDIIDGEGKLIKPSRLDNTPEIISPELHAKIALYTGSIAGNIANVAINKTALIQKGKFREDMKISADFDMWVRLAENFNVGHISKSLIQLRDHEDQLSRQSEYYIYHMLEDIEVFKYLLNYLDSNSQSSARKLLRRTKLQFYYTLMIKALMKGEVRLFLKYSTNLAQFENIWLLTIHFIGKKLGFFKVNQEQVFKWPDIRLHKK